MTVVLQALDLLAIGLILAIEALLIIGAALGVALTILIARPDKP